MASWRDAFQSWFRAQIRTRQHARSYRLRRSTCGACSPVPAVIEQLEGRTLLTFTFHGGPVITNAQIQNVYIGSDWATNPSLKNLEARLDAFASSAVSSLQIDGLTVAGYNVYRGSSVASVVDNVALDKSYPASGFGNGLFQLILDAQGNIVGFQQNIGSNPQFTGGIADDPTMTGFPTSIQGQLQAMINSGQLVAPSSNVLYNVFVEPGVIVSSDPVTGGFGAGVDANGNPENANSVIDFGGYHNAFAGTTADGQAVPSIAYTVLPFPGFPNGSFGGSNSTVTLANAFNTLTTADSHEISEAITDPDVGFSNATGNSALVGWYDDVNNGEVGDLSQSALTIDQGYLIQLMEDQNNLIINPNAVTHTLSAPQNVTVSNVTTTTAQLSWGSGGPLVQGYRVFTSLNGQNTLIATLGPTVTTYQATGLTPGATVSFVVEAFNGSTVADSVDPEATLPGTPGQATPGTNTGGSTGATTTGAATTTIVTGTSSVTVTDYTNPATGKTTHLVQNGTSTVTFIDGAGGMQLGTLINSTHAIVAGWGNDMATFNSNGTVIWSDGTIWNPTTSAPAQVTVTDYTNPVTGKTTHLVQNGTSTVTFIDGAGGMQLGTMINSALATVAGWGNDMATFNSNGTITWSDGTLWNPNSATAARVVVSDYINPVTGKTTHLIQNGTSTVVFIDGAGGIEVGSMINSAHAVVAAWGNDMATFNSNGTITWSDGTVWIPTNSAAPQVTVTSYINPVTGKTTYAIQNSTSTVVFIDGAGGIELGTMIDSTHATVAAWGNDMATFNGNGTLNWSDGTLWNH